MMKIQETETALSVFEEAATKHAEATEIGDYKIANKNYDLVLKAVLYLKEKNEIDKLFNFLTHSSIGVRMAASTYLLPKHEKEAIKVLSEISRSPGIHALSAETIISEWKKGNLKL
jgi:hypothetical protein